MDGYGCYGRSIYWPYFPWQQCPWSQFTSVYIYICYEFIEILVGSRPAKVKVYAAQSKASHTEKGHDFSFGKATNYSSKKESHR
jgi:hypothetical protein